MAVVLLVAMVVAIGLEAHEEILVVVDCTDARPYVEREVALPLTGLWQDVVAITKVGG